MVYRIGENDEKNTYFFWIKLIAGLLIVFSQESFASDNVQSYTMEDSSLRVQIANVLETYQETYNEETGITSDPFNQKYMELQYNNSFSRTRETISVESVIVNTYTGAREFTYTYRYNYTVK